MNNNEVTALVDPVVDFIWRRFNRLDANWMNGNCYYFALIITDRFKNLELGYLPWTGHFVAWNELETYYDFCGAHQVSNEPIIPLRKIEATDKRWYATLYRDCIS